MKFNISIPAQTVPLTLKDGTINPIWYDKLKTIEAFMNTLRFVDFPMPPKTPRPAPPNSGVVMQIADGQVLLWNAATGLFLPHAN